VPLPEIGERAEDLKISPDSKPPTIQGTTATGLYGNVNIAVSTRRDCRPGSVPDLAFARLQGPPPAVQHLHVVDLALQSGLTGTGNASSE